MNHSLKRIVLFSHSLLLFIAVLAVSPVADAADSTALKKIDKNGITIEYLPSVEPLAQQVHAWLGDHLKKNPYDINQDFKKLNKNQKEILGFIRKQLAVKNQSDVLNRILPDILTKFQNIGNVIPSIRHLQIWRKNDLKAYLDGGGHIPGYVYKPGPDGENELKMEQGLQASSDDPAKKIDIQSPLFPLIVKSDDPKEHLNEAKKTLTEMHQQFQKMASGMAGLFIMMSIQPAVQAEIRPPMRFFNWFTAGTAGYLTGQILNDFISQDAAQNFFDSQNIEGLAKLAPQLHLVKWLGGDPKDQPVTAQSEILKKARYSFSTLEIMGLVQRNGQECIPKIFTEIRKIAPSVASNKDQQESVKDYQPTELIGDLELLLKAIKTVTGENYQRRLLQYSLVSPPEKE